MGKKSKGTSVVKHATAQTKPLKKNIKRKQVQPAIQNRKEQHLAVAHVEVQIDNVSACDKEIQIEASFSKETQTIKMRRCDKKIQVDLPPTTIMLDNDSRTITLHIDLAQAKQTIEKITKQTVP